MKSLKHFIDVNPDLVELQYEYLMVDGKPKIIIANEERILLNKVIYK